MRSIRPTLAVCVLGVALAACSGSVTSHDAGFDVPATPDHTTLDSTGVDASVDRATVVDGPTLDTAPETSGSDGAPTDVTVLPSRGDCAVALALVPGVVLFDQSTSAGTVASTACRRSTAPQVFYALTLPAHARAVVVVTPHGGAPWTPVLRATDGCAATTCAFDAVATAPSAVLRAELPNDGDAARPLILAVSGASAGDGGTFDIVVTFVTESAPSNLTCAAALRVVGGTRLTGQNAAAATQTDGVCGSYADLPTLYYVVNVPAGEAVEAVAHIAAGAAWAPRVRITNACDDTAAHDCLGGFFATATTRFTIDPAVAYWRNDTGAARDVQLLVGTEMDAPGVFDLAVDIIPRAPNTDCASAITLTPGTTVRDQNLVSAWTLTSACPPSGGTDGPVLYYRTTIPAGDYARIALTPTGPADWHPVLRVFDDCSASACVAATDPTTENALLIRAPRDAPRDVVVAAGADYYFDGEFDLTATLSAAPTNDLCVDATPIADGTFITGGDLRLGTTSLAAVCAADATSEVLYYRATVPPGQQLEVSAESISELEILRLDACGAATCTGYSDGVNGGWEAMFWRNDSAAATDVVVAVAARSGGGVYPFDLHAGIAPPAFVQSTIAAGCDAMDTATPIAGVTMQLTTSTVLPLPFTMRFFGEDTPYYSVSWSGLLQLYPTSVGVPNLDYYIPPFPNFAGPARAVAPFWVALGANPEGSSVRVQTFGVAPARRFVAEWTDWSASTTADPTHVTFQAKLFETTGVIEFHYCRLDSAGPPPGGTSMRVGLEDATGLHGMKYPIDEGALLSTATALRYTPVP